MHPSSLFSVNLDQMFGSSLLVNLVCIISSCMCGSHFQKIMCKNQTTIEHSWHLKNSFSYFGSLVSIMHIKCCYTFMKSAMEVKICELLIH